MNLDATTGTQSSSIALAPGKYIYHVDLFSGAGASGSITGSLDAVVDTSVTSSVSVAIGKPITGITLGPSGYSVAIGQTGAIYATPTTASGAFTFAAPSDLTYVSSDTSKLTAAADGADGSSCDVTGVLTGTATVTAKSTSTNVSSIPLSVSVATSSGAKKKWTIMVFLNAANSLTDYALPNYLQMQQAVSGTDAQIVVAFKEAVMDQKSSGPLDWTFTGSDDTRYYLVQPSTGTSIVGSPLKDLGAGVDMGSYTTLANFIAYCKKNYPADRYVLDMWDHGQGWQLAAKRPTSIVRGVSYDDTTSHHIDTWDMDKALSGGNNVDILSYDACDMQSLEAGYQVRNYVNFLVGSEDLTPGNGYDYSIALLPFFNNASGDSATLAHGFVDQMVDDTGPGKIYAGQAVCQSVVDASKLTAAAAAIDSLGQALLANKTTIGAISDHARSYATKFDIDHYYHMYYDMYGLADMLQNTSGVPTNVATAAASVKSALQAAVLYNRFDTRDAGANGLTIDFSDSATFLSAIPSTAPTLSAQYSNLAFAKDYPNWYNWLKVAP